jgi:hypothetical protein
VNKSFFLAQAIAAILCFNLLPAAQAVTLPAIPASGRGWVTNTGGNNGNIPGNNYLAGNGGSDLFRNHFDFQIPAVANTLMGAILRLDNPAAPFDPDYNSDSHQGGTHNYAVYGIGPFGSYGFAGIGAGPLYGSETIAGNGTVFVYLNADAVFAISAAQGGTFSLGGVDSGETIFSLTQQEVDFANSGGSFVTTLILSVVPEPSSLALGAFGLIGFAIWGWRRKG